jgi:hypothetical protein
MFRSISNPFFMRILPPIHRLLIRRNFTTLQNPHRLPPASVPNPSAVTKVVKTDETTKTGPETTRVVTVVKAKAAVPCMIILSPSTVADPDLREYFSLFKWHARRLLDFYFSRSLTNNEL